MWRSTTVGSCQNLSNSLPWRVQSKLLRIDGRERDSCRYILNQLLRQLKPTERAIIVLMLRRGGWPFALHLSQGRWRWLRVKGRVAVVVCWA